MQQEHTLSFNMLTICITVLGMMSRRRFKFYFFRFPGPSGMAQMKMVVTGSKPYLAYS